MVEIGRVDITCGVSLMPSHSAMPHEGHLDQLFHIFSYLKQHHNSRLVFDPTYPDVSWSDFLKKEWKDYYGNASKDIPEYTAKPIGMEFIVRAYVNADFTGERLTRRFRMGFIIMLNNAPIYWYSKKQNICETSLFDSKFIAKKQCYEYVKRLRFKLRMMGIPVNNPTFIFGDNQSVLWNTSVPDSVLNKKTPAVAYNYVREGVSMNTWRTSYIKTANNPSDILTKCLPYRPNRKRKVRAILYDVYSEYLNKGGDE